METGRLTFGIIIDWPDQGSSYQKNLINGIRAYASKNDINLITLATGRLDSPHQWEKPREILLDFMRNSQIFSGFILFSSSLSSIMGTERLKEKISGLTKLPVVSLATDLKDYPSVVIDNTPGFEELIEHMLIHHGYKDIAYISGPLKHEEGLQRWEILQRICKKQKITIPDTHFYEGNFAMNSGTAAAQWFLDESKIMPEAIIAANDNMAIGAWEVLKKRNIQVPKQIAVTGFDDLQISESFDLPFTTVKQPLVKQGHEAAEKLHKIILGESIEQLTSLPSEVVYRFSCGCLSGQSKRDEAIKRASRSPQESFVAECIRQFQAAAELEFQGAKGSPIIRTWNKVILTAIEEEIRESVLFDIIGHIQKEYGKDQYSNHQKSVITSFINDMKHMVNEFYIQSDLLKRMVVQSTDQQIVNKIENIGNDTNDSFSLNQRLAMTRDIFQFTDSKFCFISLFSRYEYKQNGTSKLIYAAHDGKDLDISSSDSSFETQNLIHPDFIPKTRFEILFELLFDYDYVFGLVGIDMGSKGPNVFELVRIRLSTVVRTYIARQHLIDLNRQLQSEIDIRQETEKKLQMALSALQDLSLTDELTGLYNRRGFITIGEQQLKYCQREDEPYIVFFIDMDGLKKINDIYGHNEGDYAIRLTGRILKDSFRETDIIARLGGDEFTVFAAKANEDSIETIHNRIKKHIDATNEKSGKEYQVSMSIGTYISTSTDIERDMSLDEMLQEADQELYKAKREKKRRE